MTDLLRRFLRWLTRRPKWRQVPVVPQTSTTARWRVTLWEAHDD